ncbi:FISUMP domain-containing protein [Flavobacterium oncorhynchi]|uniref:FISUMP domain-containing protein n=1 Tax=Flavobacterium oncorhynchi TaxID=728056 RepID=UPI00351A052D
MMIKKILLKLLCAGGIMVSIATQAQTGIGTVTPASSSILDLTSTNKAFLLPRVANSTVIAAPVNGMMIFDLSSNCVKVYQNGVWVFASTEMAVSLASAAPTLCINTPLTTIYHSTSNAIGIGTPTGLPAGVTASWSSNTISIWGSPTATGIFSYNIPLVGNGCGVVIAAGTITVKPTMTVSAASASPTLLINTSLTTITHSTINAVGIGTPAGLPAGVTASWSSNIISISGTPTEAGIFNYSIPLLGCGTANATGTIIISSCGANVASGMFKVFKCHNLGADESGDPHIPLIGIHGNYYQWGRAAVVANASTSPSMISGWNTSSAAIDAWLDGSKTANDPCPAGFRIPTGAQWSGVVANNTVTRLGSWSNNSSNFGTAIKFGTGLSLQAAGYRNNSDGSLNGRGSTGYYCSSSVNLTNRTYFSFTSTTAGLLNANSNLGVSVRCISE